MSTATREFHEARDLLFELRDKPAAAAAQFRWPRLQQFNWALDHFDVMARGNDATALWIVEADGTAYRASFAQLSTRSAQVANFLREHGVQRGERILLMLGN